MAGTAHAERSLVILLDGTGSMTQIRTDGVARFDAAKDAAVADLLLANGETEGLEQVAVFMFYGNNTAVRLSGTAANPFTTNITGAAPDSAESIINAASVTFEATPLAGAMCAAVTTARNSSPSNIFFPPRRLLKVYTDGEENFTPMTDACYGPASVVLHEVPFDDGSWHQKVYQLTTNPLPAVQVSTTLYTNVATPFAAFTFSPPAPVENGAPGPAPAAFGILADPVSDLEFFSILTRDNGGRFQLVNDTAPAPVIGDLDFDFDVDRDDAIALARAFGTHPGAEYDLDGDGTIGYGDYTRLLPRFGDGSGSPSADPYTQGTVVKCQGARTVIIENAVIEASGLTIQGKGACNVEIRNSLIVSGSTGITTRGVAAITVDNSYVIGEGKWLDSSGVAVLSAANSVFHGARTSNGVFSYLDRGGNTFE